LVTKSSPFFFDFFKFLDYVGIPQHANEETGKSRIREEECEQPPHGRQVRHVLVGAAPGRGVCALVLVTVPSARAVP